MIIKVGGKITAGFGAIDEVHKVAHTGIDIALKTGTELYSPVNGVVERIIDYGTENIGKGLVIKTDSGERVILGHLSEWKVKLGEHISQGDLVALSGNTGHSTGPHLHLGAWDGKFIDPSKYLTDTNQVHETFLGAIQEKFINGVQGINENIFGWLWDKTLGDPTGTFTILLFFVAMYLFKPTRLFLLPSMFIYILMLV